MALMGSIRNRALLIGLVALLLAMWVLRAAFHMAGAAMRFILIIGIVLIGLAWVTSKVGRGKRR